MDRLTRLREAMAAQDVDFIALGPGAHLAWLLGLHPHADERPLLACITAEKIGFLMPALEVEKARAHTDLPFYVWSDEDGPEEAFLRLLSDLDTGAVRSFVIDETMRADFAALVQDNLMNARRQFTETTVGALRMRKDDTEYRALKANAALADTAMKAAWAGMRPGMTELEVASIVRECFKENGAEPVFWIVGAGPNGAFPHHQTGDTVLKHGDAVVIDIGAARDDYSSDITRMALIGEPPEGYMEVHGVVEAAVRAGLAAARPGARAHEIDDAARGVIADAGYGEFFVHRTGHGLGVEVHEPPYISASSQTILDEGMVFSIEPGIYLPGRFGLRLEDIVILRADGPEILSELPREAVVIGD